MSTMELMAETMDYQDTGGGGPVRAVPAVAA
jgi:hypothetical protein